jgi:hypothetical protein
MSRNLGSIRLPHYDRLFGRHRREQQSAIQNPAYFGRCPSCHGNNGFINVGRSHFVVCHEHRCFWPIGSSLFHGWMLEDEEAWERNAALLSRYSEVEPLYSGELAYA